MRAEQPPAPIGFVGANVARLRSVHRLTLSALSQRSGVAKATLSELEAGRGNPTLETLWAVATALRVPFSDLVAAEEVAGVRVSRVVDLPALGGSGEQARLLDRLAGYSMLEIFELLCPPKSDRLAPAHGPEVFETLLLTSGKLYVGPEDDPRGLAAGEMIQFPADRPHRYNNATDVAAQAIVWIAYPRP